MLRYAALAVYFATLAIPCSAQQVGSDDSTVEDGSLVTSSDVQTCPYRFVQPVTINVTEDYGADRCTVRQGAEVLGVCGKCATVAGETLGSQALEQNVRWTPGFRRIGCR